MSLINENVRMNCFAANQLTGEIIDYLVEQGVGIDNENFNRIFEHIEYLLYSKRGMYWSSYYQEWFLMRDGK